MKKIMVHFNMPGVTAKQYDDAWKDLKAAGQSNPKGLIHHTGGVHGKNLVVADVWQSQEAFEKFSQTLMPILQKHKFPNVAPVIIPVHYDFAGVEATMQH